MKKEWECLIRRTPLTDPGVCTYSVYSVGIRDRHDTSSGCGIVVKKERESGIRRTPLTDPDV